MATIQVVFEKIRLGQQTFMENLVSKIVTKKRKVITEGLCYQVSFDKKNRRYLIDLDGEIVQVAYGGTKLCIKNVVDFLLDSLDEDFHSVSIHLLISKTYKGNRSVHSAIIRDEQGNIKNKNILYARLQGFLELISVIQK